MLKQLCYASKYLKTKIPRLSKNPPAACIWFGDKHIIQPRVFLFTDAYASQGLGGLAVSMNATRKAWNLQTRGNAASLGMWLIFPEPGGP